MNFLLLAACITLLIAFPSSSQLAAAYGIAVTGTMITTSILFYTVARRRFGWSAPKGLLIVGLFLVADVTFFSANADKIPAGGWVPLAIGASVFAVMTTWRRGRNELASAISAHSL